MHSPGCNPRFWWKCEGVKVTTPIPQMLLDLSLNPKTLASPKANNRPTISKKCEEEDFQHTSDIIDRIVSSGQTSSSRLSSKSANSVNRRAFIASCTAVELDADEPPILPFTDTAMPRAAKSPFLRSSSLLFSPLPPFLRASDSTLVSTALSLLPARPVCLCHVSKTSFRRFSSNEVHRKTTKKRQYTAVDFNFVVMHGKRFYLGNSECNHARNFIKYWYSKTSPIV